MKTVLILLGAFALTLCVNPSDASEMETELTPNLMDLPVELRLDIFEHLRFFDLIHVGNTHPENRNLVGTVLRNKLKNHKFRIARNSKPETLIYYEDFKFANISYDYFDKNVRGFLEFFQVYGHSISEIEILNEESGIKGLDIMKGLAYVPISLKEFNFIFPNAKKVKLSEYRIDVATIHRMFPAVRSLNLHSIKLEESLCHFPHLEHLETPMGWGFHKLALPLFKQTFESNPQLKHLTIPYCKHWEILQTLNEIRPNLERLDISDFMINGDEIAANASIRFTNIKALKCLLSSSENMQAVPWEFGNLEEIEFNRKDSTEYWVDVMMQNKNLRKVTTGSALQHDIFERIADGLPNLEEFTMKYAFDDTKSVPDIVDFLQRANQLKKASFLGLLEDMCNEAAEQLKNEWKMTGDWRSCYFVRKEL